MSNHVGCWYKGIIYLLLNDKLKLIRSIMTRTQGEERCWIISNDQSKLIDYQSQSNLETQRLLLACLALAIHLYMYML